MVRIQTTSARLCLLGIIFLLLAACSSKQTDISTPPTRSFEHAAGKTEVPVKPLRVASDQHMGQLLKLGIKPVAVRENMLKEAWIPYANLDEQALEGIEDLGGFPLNLEKLTLVEPDLIISALPNNQEQYSKIAPTVHIPYWSESYKTPMDKLLKIASLFDKTAVAENWIKEFEGKLADAQKKIADAGKLKEGQTVSVMAVFDKNVFVFGPNGAYGGYMIYDYLKLKPTDKVEELRNKDMGSAELSLEAVPEYMGDHAFITVVNEDKAKELLESDFWKSIPAVMNEQVYFYDSKIFAMDDPYSLEAQLDAIVNLLTGAK
ncbi:ABC transporter substrate-binding protein [Paenibacillus eucommiae]|uniref:Iron complex transport system substrate-binding protein n=1 Tax=Paenibacillus eucommiae TaxID=1355755 RepID=A0ABS4IVZ9_9BACL|nr:ABC transporter substrate-binding protein [Paenibacillus eucommiae]MBP1991773.1 iron complex transport system substrate-binding protein [Paenibacillus eucommiae]